MKNSDLLLYAAAAIIITILCGVIYVTVQQSHRSGANDPQLQIARDISNRLKNNQPVDQLMGTDTIEISNSLAVFTALYDDNGDPVQSTGLLGGQLPKIPRGVFNYAKQHGENVLSWQPQRGVRMATVVEAVQSHGIGFVAVSRSLNEVEKRVNNLTTMVFLGWIASIGCIGIVFLINRISPGSKKL